MPSPRRWVPWASGAACSAWALAALLTVIPDADRVADGIQVQSLLVHPRLVLAFPGQAHGGVLEYPFLLLAEWAAPGNYFAHSAIRVVLAFLTGFFAARLFLRLFPQAPSWSFIGAVISGPFVMHAITGPEGNPVGVMWIHANYPQSWVLTTAGAALLADAVAERERVRAGLSIVAGLLIGLGVYEQPGVLLLAVPLVVMIMLAFPHRMRVWAVAASASVVGMVLIVAAYLLHHRDSVYNPAHLPIPSLPATLTALGLDGLPHYVSGLLPAALGFAPIDDSPIRLVARILVPLFAALIVVGLAVSLVRYRRDRQATPAMLITVAWTLAMAGMAVMSWALSPVWFYAGCLGVLLWLSIGALPVAVRAPWGSVLAAASIGLLATSTLVQAVPWYRSAPERFEAKVQHMEDLSQLADAIVAAGGTDVYGSFWDVMPLAYSSGGRLHPSAVYYNRFPLPAGAPDPITVFVNVQPTEYHGDDALTKVQQECIDAGVRVTSGSHVFGEFRCPRDVVSPPR